MMAKRKNRPSGMVISLDGSKQFRPPAIIHCAGIWLLQQHLARWVRGQEGDRKGRPTTTPALTFLACLDIRSSSATPLAEIERTRDGRSKPAMTKLEAPASFALLAALWLRPVRLLTGKRRCAGYRKGSS